VPPWLVGANSSRSLLCSLTRLENQTTRDRVAAMDSTLMRVLDISRSIGHIELKFLIIDGG
jgi:hypothetical protein